MKIGYARVSTDAQETHLQMDALKGAKCTRVYQEKASGAKAERPELMRLLDNARKGDVVIVWKLDRLARSLRQLIDTTVLLNARGVEWLLFFNRISYMCSTARRPRRRKVPISPGCFENRRHTEGARFCRYQ